MNKEEIINKVIELEFGSGNAKSIRESNSSLVKVAEHLYDLMTPSLPSNLGEAAEKYEDRVMNDYDELFVTEDGEERPVLKYDFTDAFKA